MNRHSMNSQTEQMQRQRRGIARWQVIAFFMALYDFAAVCGAYFLALLLRVDGIYRAIPVRYLMSYRACILPVALVAVIVFLLFRMYNSMWKFASFSEFMRAFLGSLTASAIHSVAITVLCRRMPLSYHILGAGFQFILLLVVRFFNVTNGWREPKHVESKNVMLIGAGNAAQMILRDMTRANEINDRVACIIDDDPNKWHRTLDGIPVVGGRDDILSAVERYKVDKIFLAIPSASMQQKRDILAICSETGCELRQLPGMFQLMLGQVSVSDLKKVSVEDLLGREPIRADLEEVFSFINGKTVMVTGGGGSIGSELCRQIAAHNPRQLIIFDIYENNAYSIQLELKEKYPKLNLVTLIGSVRDSRRMFEVFETYRPQIVYHAAAHKHVPLMEDSPCEAIKNNAIGTYKTAYAAMMHGCERFVLISTDKAVHPTNIMGASKRLCEMIVQSFDRKIKAGQAGEIPQLFTHEGIENADKVGDGKVFEGIRTEFVAVRFGNVLGSNGSVIPLFKKQIEKGGPVTVTHPDIIRYFMTIPEAVSLVMLAGTYAKGGEIFVLDMGSPVKIDTLARNLIRLSGLKPDVDIKIEYTGLRPGEKLYEEKLMEAAYANREGDIRGMVKAIVPGYHLEDDPPELPARKAG